MPGPEEYTLEELRAYARAEAERQGVDPDIVERLLMKESGFNPKARGKSGEIGIAQIIPRNHPDVDPTDPIASIDYLVRFLKDRLAATNDSYTKAVASWNAGTPTVDRGVIPASTQKYVSDIVQQSGEDVGGTSPSSGYGTTNAQMEGFPTARQARAQGYNVQSDQAGGPAGGRYTGEPQVPVRPFGSMPLSDYDANESAQYFPWADKAAGGEKQAISNILALLGLNPYAGDPFAQMVQGRIPRLLDAEQLRLGLAGNDMLDPSQKPGVTLAQNIMDYVRGGKASPFADPMAAARQLRDLGSRIQTQGVGGLNAGEMALQGQMETGGAEWSKGALLTMLAPMVSPYLLEGFANGLQARMEDWRRSRGDAPNRTVLEALMAGF